MGETPAGTAADSVLPYDINVPDKVLTDEQVRRMKYRDYLPTWEPVFFPPLKPFEFRDPALDAKDNLVRTFSPRGVRFEDIQPKMGTIVRGLQLTGLGPDEKNQLARLVAERKVVVFEDQDFVDAGPAFQESWMRHFGKLNYQPVSGSIKGHPAFQINQRAGNKDEIDRFLEQHTTTTLWHQDVSFEIQPPGYVLLGMFEGPPCGGDTIFCDAEQAFE